MRSISMAAMAALLLVAVAPAQTPVPAGRYQLVASRSELAIRLRKAGLFSALADNHLIVAGQMHGSAEGGAAGWSGEIVAPTAELQVADPGRPAKDRREIWQTMEGPGQLDAARYPNIVWRLDGLSRTASGFELRGSFTLHGVTRPVVWPTRVEIGDGRVRVWGQAQLRLTDFGIQPIHRALGTVRVRNQFELQWDTEWRKR